MDILLIIVLVFGGFIVVGVFIGRVFGEVKKGGSSGISETPVDPSALAICQARFAAGRLLTLTAKHISASTDKFAVWMLAGFGVGFALVFSRIHEVANLIDVDSIRHCGWVFSVAVVACGVEHYIALSVGAVAKQIEKVIPIIKEYPDMNLAVFNEEMQRGVPAVLKRISAKFSDATEKKDFASFGRFLVRLTFYQFLLVLLESILLTVGLMLLVSAVAVP